jgi:hypothetical protein
LWFYHCHSVIKLVFKHQWQPKHDAQLGTDKRVFNFFKRLQTCLRKQWLEKEISTCAAAES